MFIIKMLMNNFQFKKKWSIKHRVAPKKVNKNGVMSNKVNVKVLF